MVGTVSSEDDPSEMMLVDTADMMSAVRGSPIVETQAADVDYQRVHSWPRSYLQRQIVSEAMSLSRAGSKPMGEILFGYSPLASTRLDQASMINWECAIWPSLAILDLFGSLLDGPRYRNLTVLVTRSCLEQCYGTLKNSLRRIGPYPRCNYAVATRQEKRSWSAMVAIAGATWLLAKQLGCCFDEGIYKDSYSQLLDILREPHDKRWQLEIIDAFRPYVADSRFLKKAAIETFPGAKIQFLQTHEASPTESRLTRDFVGFQAHFHGKLESYDRNNEPNE
ncbi:hypothetical protein LTR47_011489 [Exophiala xenobiotica]|nr:hypothetical protein LTR47_011489 [Exophiala xenobiotica]KAK5227266.1 hypothetical protein LTR72_003256 [Exophiala xenobiotica]KAK5301015.1 hypothetical protein LTR14_001413 [Exophiala xenobiotica]KAK5320638.1 hypothetical protein LTR93_006850 [Exophiala xenobiotica]KAK5351867.1 hypothetical protein LTR61_004117 [Exophiala xenobiotica]